MVAKFASGGARVATAARSQPAKAENDVFCVEANLSAAAGVQQAAEAIIDRYGGVDILVHCLGGSSSPGGGFLALSDENWRAELDLNLMPAVRLDRAFAPGTIERRRGVIVHVSSIQRRMPL